MPAPSKISFQPPVLRSEAQMRALRSATTSGLIEEYQARKQRVYAHFHCLRSGAQKSSAASAAQLADIDHQQTLQISALNQELDNKLACLLVDAGPGPALEHAGSAAAAYAQWASAVLGARQAQGQPTSPTGRRARADGQHTLASSTLTTPHKGPQPFPSPRPCRRRRTQGPAQASQASHRPRTMTPAATSVVRVAAKDTPVASAWRSSSRVLSQVVSTRPVSLQIAVKMP